MTARLLVLIAAAASAAELRLQPVAKTPEAAVLAADSSGRLYLTDVAASRILRLAAKGRLETVRENTNAATGLAFDPQGRLILCETSDVARRHPRVVRIDLATGSSETLAEAFGGKPLNGPRHVATDSKGRIYFTDPPGAVYRIDDVGSGAQIIAAPNVNRPNGIAVAPDDRTLYVAEPGAVFAFPLDPDGNAGPRRQLHARSDNTASGLCVDTRGILYVAARELLALSSDGKVISRTALKGALATGCAIAGPDRRDLFVLAGNRLLLGQPFRLPPAFSRRR